MYVERLFNLAQNDKVAREAAQFPLPQRAGEETEEIARITVRP